ncbi:MAG TPA: archaeosortase/exosortase family protein, partial [Gemmataceae bacterium]|nr:archaeosortase/exosortase family protein [Gemmataceae bacterium]
MRTGTAAFLELLVPGPNLWSSLRREWYIIHTLITMLRSPRIRPLAGLAGVLLILLWAYWPTLCDMAEKWSTDAQYSHGFLVPLFAGFLLWYRRGQFPTQDPRPSAWGVVLIGVGLGLHLFGAYIYIDWLDMVSLLPLLAGLCLCYGGRPVLRWALPSIGFLAFMLPLPHTF